MEHLHNGVLYAGVKKQRGRYLWTDMEWVPRHDATWKKKKCKRLLIGCSPLGEKQGDMRKHICICSFVQKESRKDKLETEEKR